MARISCSNPSARAEGLIIELAVATGGTTPRRLEPVLLDATFFRVRPTKSAANIQRLIDRA